MTIDLTQDRLPLQQTPDGTIRFEGSRMTLDTIVRAYATGRSAEAIAAAYPSVPLAHVYAALAYYLSHRSAVDAYLAARAERAEEDRREEATRSPSARIREWWLARRRVPGR